MPEAGEIREHGVERDVRADVEAARHVVHRHGRNARDEQALQRRVKRRRERLQFREKLLEEPVSVAEGVVRPLAAFGKDRVGEVVAHVGYGHADSATSFYHCRSCDICRQ